MIQLAFLECVVFCGAGSSNFELAEDAQAFLTERGMKRFYCLPGKGGEFRARPGPYIILGNRLREVWRLYHNTNGAFFLRAE